MDVYSVHNSSAAYRAMLSAGFAAVDVFFVLSAFLAVLTLVPKLQGAKQGTLQVPQL